MTLAAAVFTIGNTDGGCEFAIHEILRRETGSIDVYLFYGEPATEQKESPLATVATLESKSFDGRVCFIERKGTHAFSIDDAYFHALDLIRQIRKRNYVRVYLGITGATNPMVSSLFHAGVTELHNEVIPVYVQGRGTQSIEFFTGTRTRDAITIERVLDLARASQLSIAAKIAEDLPSEGRAGFIRRSVQTLAAWDDFRYDVATEFKPLKQHTAYCADDPSLVSTVATIRRYHDFAGVIAFLDRCYANPTEFRRMRESRDWRDRVSTSGPWLPADAFSNAKRRAREGRFTDAVLRAYRAVETAIQCRLFALGVHPSHLDWTTSPLNSVSDHCRGRTGNQLPEQVAFESGLKLLSLLTGETFESTINLRRELQSARNLSYLEHGYSRIDEKGCNSSLDKAQVLCEQILGTGAQLTERLVALDMQF